MVERSQGSVASFSTVASQQTTKAGVRRLKKQICNRFWDYVDDFAEWRCLSRSDNVWMVRCTTSRGLLCIQSFPKATVDARLRLYKMLLMLEELVEQIPFILKIYDIVEDKGAMLVCSEFCSRGTLCDALNDLGCISNMGWLVCEGLVPLMIVLHHMHSSGVVHRNVTPSCVWFQKDGSARIGGFELASQLSDVAHREIVGSLEFIAPEMLLCSANAESNIPAALQHPDNAASGQRHISYSYFVDVWSLGITMYLCLTGTLPFNGGAEDNTEVLFQNILLSEPEYPEHMDSLAVEFVRACLAKEPGDRPDMKELLAHAFVQKHLQWERAPSERTPDMFYELPPEEIQDIDIEASSRFRRMFARSARKYPKAIVFPNAAAAVAGASLATSAAAASAGDKRMSLWWKPRESLEIGYTSYQSRQSVEASSWRRRGSEQGGPGSFAEAVPGGVPKWKHFPSASPLVPRPSLELLDAAGKSQKYARTIAAMDTATVHRVESASPGPLTPAARVEAWKCGEPAASSAVDTSDAVQAATECAPNVPAAATEAELSGVVPSGLLGGDAVIQIPSQESSGAVGSSGVAGGVQVAGSSAEMPSPRTMAADTRWSVKWVDSWTGDTSPRSPLASPRNQPPGPAAPGGGAQVAAAGAGAPDVVAAGGSAPVQDVRAFSPIAESSADVVGVGRRGLVEVGDADGGTVMWSRSVPRTPASAASTVTHSEAGAMRAGSPLPEQQDVEEKEDFELAQEEQV